MDDSQQFHWRAHYEALHQVPTNDWNAVFRSQGDTLLIERCVSMGSIRRRQMRAPVIDGVTDWDAEEEVSASTEFGGMFRMEGYGFQLADIAGDFVGYVRVDEDPYVVLAREIEILHGDFLRCRPALPSTATVPARLS